MIKKKILTLLTLFLVISPSLFSQTQKWYEIPGAPSQTNPSGRLEFIDFINSNTGWVISSSSGLIKVLRTTNNGVNWATVFEPSEALPFRSIAFFDSLNGILGNLNTTKTLFRTTNGGYNWTQITTFDGAAPKGICGLHKVNDSVMYGSGWYAADARIVKTTDKGLTWKSYSLNSLAKGLTDCYFFNQDSGFAVGWKGGTYSGPDAYGVVLFTSNGGANWVTQYTTTHPRQNCWKINFPTRNVGYISLETFSAPVYFLKTTNGGASWQEKLFSNQPYEAQGIGFMNENTGWIGGARATTKYSYKTTNGGETWDSVGTLKNVNKFLFMNDTMGFAVGTTIYRFGTSTVNIRQISSVVPASFELLQNYPNPFNPVTNFEFLIKHSESSRSSDVKLKVYDVSGKLISTFFEGNLEPGKYKVTFDGSNLNSGVYFYTLESDNFKETKKMVLLK